MENTLKEVLEGTNWRLLSNSLSYRLGYVSGQLKGAEQEEDLWEMSGRKKETEKPSKIDPELLKKHSGDNMVQLARMMGKFEAEENMRKRRLEKEPDGFILGAREGGSYTCKVCWNSTPGEEAWWDLRGIRCLDCQRNFKEGIVPPEIFEEDYGYELFINHSKFKDDYGVYPITVKKLRKEGLIHGRDLKRKDGTVYYTLYLVRENQEFLIKYPKKIKT
jgi:hypothetical protein